MEASADNRPVPDPVTFLATWMEWERGELPPGKVLSDLKRAGMRELLEALVEAKQQA